jgi:septum formation protein
MAADPSPAAQRGGRLVLGTASSARRAVLDAAVAAGHVPPYVHIAADIDEKAIRDSNPDVLVLKLAHAKADALLPRLGEVGMNQNNKDDLLITCDQVVTFGNDIREKPADATECRAWLTEYSQVKDIPLITRSGVVVTRLLDGRRVEAVDHVRIYFGHIPETSIDRVLDDGEILWCAGGLQAEHAAMAPCITRMEGEMDSVMGLPMKVVQRLMDDLLRLE